MTREEAIEKLELMRQKVDEETYRALVLAIKALSQEPCELLIIKSDILLHQDDRKKWAESIKREKESGVIILPPYFEPLLVPNDIEINIEQESCDDAISRQAILNCFKKWQPYMATRLWDFEKELSELPSVTQKSGKWLEKEVCNDKDNGVDAWQSARCSKCGKYHTTPYMYYFNDFEFCPRCGAYMVEPQ